MIQERHLHNNSGMMISCLSKLNSTASFKSNITLSPITHLTVMIALVEALCLGFKVNILNKNKKIFKT
jgi:hypothetical protein